MQPSAGLVFALGLSFCLIVDAVPHMRRDEVSLQNGKDTIAFKYALHTPLLATQGSMVADHRPSTVPSSRPSARCLPAKRMR